VTSTKRLPVMLIAAAALTIAATLPVEAQIMYPFPPYRTAVHDSSVRLEVTPRQTEVFVDGYYAGVVDDFDGMLQRLRVEPGQHEITLYHDGYRTVRQRVYLVRDRTIKIRLQMEPLAPGEAGEARPSPAPPLPVGVQPSRPLPRDPRGVPPTSGPSTPVPPTTASTGRLTIQLQPADADVVIDGQPWAVPPGQDTVVVDLSEGRHVVQVRKPGFVGYLTEVEVRRGETTTVDVSLRPQP
jgi:PEGA domain-containing protein